MEEKHTMLYPPLDAATNTLQREQRISASVAMGLPVEPPPSYDAAMYRPRSTHASVWMQNVGAAEPTSVSIMEDSSMQPAILPAVPPQQPQNPNQAAANAVPEVSVVVTNISKLGPQPCAVTCPVCGECKTTRMVFTPNTRTHLCALLLCLVGWCCCACWVPYCMTSCRTGNHYCSKCNTFLGSYNPHDSK